MINKDHDGQQQHLAWHETLDMHELVAFQSISLMRLKFASPMVHDPELKQIYTKAIDGISNNLRELLQFYPYVPRPERDNVALDPAFYAGNLLGFAKTSVRSYAIAITETATPALRQVLTRQILAAIDLHATVFNYMLERSYYPSYDLTQLLQNDVNLANKALSYQH
ncbi:spore coat protein [Sporolactobacillus sp. THM19-2]|uniref:spore coat protein n=1 Tax=Sporolactobacillus sp. THM19-2 TaxID=2511171 RepID=UPI0010205734|nr:spore coat protein [Sporolactobacillus sp. THM19-2]RYL90309.1 spore coat protein [Sporolactobacillus sp. THM19-2]